MPHKPRALIVGGSVGGLFAANLLRAVGWDTIVFERATGDLASRGAAIGIPPILLGIMRRIGLPLDTSLAAMVRSYIALERDGSVAHELGRQSITGAWAHIYRPLRDNVPDAAYRSGMALARVEQDAGSVTAIFTDGARAQGDLLIGADGIYSTVRQQLAPDVMPRYAGYVAWRGVVGEADIPPADHATIFEHLIFCLPDGELLLDVPMPADATASNPRARQRRCCYVWYRPADPDIALPRLFTDASGQRHGVSIPPTLIRPDVIRDLKDSAEAIFAPAIARLVARAEQPLLQAIVDLESSRLMFGRVVLLGDAAYVARPHIVAGVTKAALDAQCLADCLAAPGVDIGDALARYERERLEFGSKIVAYARYLGAYLEAAPGKRPERNAATLLREYGAAHLLRAADNVDAGRT